MDSSVVAPSTSAAQRGLTSAEVAERVARGESNLFVDRSGRTYWEIFRDNVLNLFNIVLLTLLVILLFFRDWGPVIFAGVSVVSNTILGMFQEMSAKRKLDQLAALSVRQARVYRDGQVVTLASHDVVKDDVILIEPGDRLVVDGTVVSSDALEVDESHLTGESDAIQKAEGDSLYSGAYCTAGAGVMVATKVGKDSTINKLSAVAKVYRRVLTPSQQKIAAIVSVTVLLMVLIAPLILVDSWLNQESARDLVRNAVVFVSSIVPQGLVLVATLSLTIGALSISRLQTLIQRVNAVESMAYVTTLCLDKTGTITQNKLTVTQIIPLGATSDAELRQRLSAYIDNLAHQNRTAVAIANYVGTHSANGVGVTKVREVPFTSARKWGAVVLANGTGAAETWVMGAPERLLPPDHPAVAQSLVLSHEGMRVVAFGKVDGVIDGTHSTLQMHGYALVVMSDVVRENIQATLAMFQAQGVNVKIISGDNEETVRAIAAQAGLALGKSYTGAQLDAMDDTTLRTVVQQADLFARISPDNKRRIVAALRAQDQYVAMVGDGVNDVPALKEANLAVVMNDGAQISKDIADIVLLNNDVSTLPLAFSEGKEITQTIFGTTKMFMVKNVYSLLFIVFVGVMSMPFPITPVQISWVTFGVVNIPATLIAFKVLRPTLMLRFRQDVLDFVLVLGVIGGAGLSAVFALAYLSSGSTAAGRSAVTIYMALMGVLTYWMIQGIDVVQPQTLAGRWQMFWLGLLLGALTIALPFAIPFIPFLSPDIFDGFTGPSLPMWGAIIGIFALSVLLCSVVMRTRQILGSVWYLSDPK